MVNTDKIAIIGLGYVGLPLAVEFGKQRHVIGFDINLDRINELKAGLDKTKEVDANELADAKHLRFSSNIDDLLEANIYIITVPTPIDQHKRPDLTPLMKASETVGRALRPGGLVIYESTVYPGCTEDDCVPILERESGLKFNSDFFCGYSPERINPGDKQHRLPSILKVTSGSTPEAAETVDQLYAAIITAGTFKAESIRVAEAAKIIENTQRDLNIALMNELSIIFGKMGIDTHSVLAAAGTKWNFLNFKPGLVGGHCIGVDPYYLTHKAQSLGYHPEVILAGRRVNDGMGEYLASQIIRLMIKKEMLIQQSKILILGITFKENCPDIRNTKVIDVVNELKEYGAKVDIWDPWVIGEDLRKHYSIDVLPSVTQEYDAVVLAVAHDDFVKLGANALRLYAKPGGILVDIKGVLKRDESDLRF